MFNKSLVFQLEENTYFTKVWGTHMLRVCLGILKNLPQYAYKLYAYKKKNVPYNPVFLMRLSMINKHFGFQIFLKICPNFQLRNNRVQY